ncbi:MAG: type I pullulanase [Halanaerobiaceae bacterium]
MNINEYYEGNDLGVVCSGKTTTFKVWSPTATGVRVKLYAHDTAPDYRLIREMRPSRDGTWKVEIDRNLKGFYYTYQLEIEGKMHETVDPYAVAAGTNSRRALIIVPGDTDPPGWERDERVQIEKRTDAVIYEVHVRDFSSSINSGIKNSGLYLGFTEEGTVGPGRYSTGIDHLQKLGITHVHLLPVFDYITVDDTSPDDYNWGYDPHLYNVPEGSYATDPADNSRIKEFKQLVMALHDRNIGVIMDVVYNHTFHLDTSPFNLTVPGYYYRYDSQTCPSNGSGCGNEIASEKPMVRKFIVDSVKYWAKEYHIDGFRFDLMALMDKETMRQIEVALKEIDSSILIYGEPWPGGLSVLPPERQMSKGAQQGTMISVFNDNFRNALKGDNDGHVRGYISGEYHRETEVKKGIVGSINYSEDLVSFTGNAGETINYVSAHDNLTLWDKLACSNGDCSEEDRIKMDRLAQAIVLTSQGVPFIAGGEEFLRTKFGEHNSYNAGDEVNQLKWERKQKYYDTYLYYRGLIRLRREHPAFRMDYAEEIKENLRFFPTPRHTIGFILKDHAGNDQWKDIVVIYNPYYRSVKCNLPEIGHWHIVVNGEKAGVETLGQIKGYQVDVPALSAFVLYR